MARAAWAAPRRSAWPTTARASRCSRAARSELDETVAALRERGSPDAVGLSVDVTDARAVEAAFAELGARWGALNALVNTVGPGDTGTIDTLSRRGLGSAASSSG